jgi:hypothetical protein
MSDTHVGFGGEANRDAMGTLRDSIGGHDAAARGRARSPNGYTRGDDDRRRRESVQRSLG